MRGEVSWCCETDRGRERGGLVARLTRRRPYRLLDAYDGRLGSRIGEGGRCGNWSDRDPRYVPQEGSTIVPRYVGGARSEDRRRGRWIAWLRPAQGALTRSRVAYVMIAGTTQDSGITNAAGLWIWYDLQGAMGAKGPSRDHDRIMRPRQWRVIAWQGGGLDLEEIGALFKTATEGEKDM